MKARHYRVVKKEVENKTQNSPGIFIPEQKRNYIIIAAVVLAVVIFVKGLVLGAIFSHNS
ncbi:MAG: hypothetical protein LBV08_06245 [Clostridiales bacterium]|jgi:hypothetical protein|nr:hypothetical protein [Clostridiales bacterium]